jgi:hypothetical protein
MQPFRQIKLANGLTVCFYEHTHRYFGDYHRIRIDITCQIPVLEEYFDSHLDWEKALRHLGKAVEFRRSIEQMGVPTAELRANLESAVDNFCAHAIQYITAIDFPRKVIQSELNKLNSSISRRYHG